MSAGNGRLRSLVERIERLEDEKREVAEQISEVKREAKGDGYDVRVITMLIKRRRMKPHDRREMDELLATYEAAMQGELFEGEGLSATATLVGTKLDRVMKADGISGELHGDGRVFKIGAKA